MTNKVPIENKNLATLKDRMISYLKESRGISLNEEIRLGDDILSKPQRAAHYIEFFKKNVSANLEGMHILDFGSGDGIYSMEFSKLRADVVGIDIDNVLVRITNECAVSEGLNVRFVNYRDDRIPLEDNHFDYAYCLQTFEHLRDPAYYLKELYRILKKGGLLHISFPNRFYPYDDHAQLPLTPWLPYKGADLLTRICRKRCLKYYSDLHFYSYRKLEKILDESQTKFSIVMTSNSPSLIKNYVIKLLNRFNIHYTILSQNISVILEKI